MIGYVEEVVSPKGRWLGVELEPTDPFRKNWYWGQKSEQEVLDCFSEDTEVLSKKDFFLRYWRVFFLPRTNDPEASWETLIDLAGQDPLQVQPRIRTSENHPTGRSKRFKSRIDHAMERNARRAAGLPAYEPSQPVAVRKTKVPLSQVRTYTLKEDGSIWISPVNYAKVIGLPPQYVYQAVSKGKLRTKQGPKSKLISLTEADRYYRREVNDEDRQGTAGGGSDAHSGGAASPGQGEGIESTPQGEVELEPDRVEAGADESAPEPDPVQ